VIVTVTACPVFLLVTLTVEPKGSDLCAAVMSLSLRGMPLAVFDLGCDESPTAYTDATQSSARTEMLIKQSMIAAINRRMHISGLLGSTGRHELKFAALQRKCRRNNADCSSPNVQHSFGS
jgi:hypothetical protein